MTVDNDIPNFCEGLAGQRPLMRRCPAFPRITTGKLGATVGQSYGRPVNADCFPLASSPADESSKGRDHGQFRAGQGVRR